MVSSTSRSASRSPATASATTASRRSPEIVIVGGISSVTNGTYPGRVAQLNDNGRNGPDQAHATRHTPPRRRTVSADSSRIVTTSARRVRRTADVGQQAGQRPAQRDDSQPRRGLQRSIGQTAGRLDIARAAQRRGQHDIRLHVVPGRAERRGQFDGVLGVSDRGRTLAPRHRQFRRHPCQAHRPAAAARRR